MTYDNVLGLDISLSRLGMASVDLVSGAISTRALSTTNRGHGRLQYLVKSVSVVADTFDLAAIEAPQFGKHLPGYHELAGLWWMVKHEISWTLGLPVILISPKTRAKYATGNGNSAKPAVHKATQGLWPELPLRTHDEADALLLAMIAARVVGSPADGQVPRERFNPVNKLVVEAGRR